MSKVYKFSDFILDTNAISLYYQRKTVQMSPRAFEILVLLIEKRGKIVEKEEILERVWSDSFVEESNLAVHISALRRVLMEKKGETRFIRTVSGRGYIFIEEVEETDSSFSFNKIPQQKDLESKNPLSIAILPFTIENGSENEEYLARGVTQSLIGDLSKIGDLRVLAYNAVKDYKNSELDLREIAFLLDADKVLLGTISEFGGKREVNAELINAVDKRCLWSFSQSFDSIDIFEVKQIISREIAQKLKFDIFQNVSEKEINNEAQRLYYCGKAVLESRGMRRDLNQVLHRALKFFEESVKREPNYALGYVGIGNVYVSLRNHNLTDYENALSKAENALQMALKADENLSEVYVLKASIEVMLKLNLTEAEKTLRKAIELNPNNPDAYNWKSIVCRCLGKFEEALDFGEKAVRLDPASDRFNSNLIRVFFHSENYHKTIVASENYLDFNDRSLSSIFFLSLSYAGLGFFDRALEYADKAIESLNNAETQLNKAYILALSGKCQESVDALQRVLASYSESQVDKVDIAVIYGALGDLDNGFLYIKKAIDERSVSLMGYRIENRFRCFLNDKRFEECFKIL